MNAVEKIKDEMPNIDWRDESGLEFEPDKIKHFKLFYSLENYSFP